MRGVHDLGGLPGGKVAGPEHSYEPWEKRVDAMFMLMMRSPRMEIKVDEVRRHIEKLGPGAYENYKYYERWLHAMIESLLARGILTTAELAAKIEQIKAREGHVD